MLNGPYLAKGGDLNAMIAELHGKATGCTGGLGGSMHLVDESAGFMGAAPVVGDAVSMAIGSALGFKMDGSGRVAVAFFGDSAVETGQFWEAANFAALHRLPVMLICENNLYATATPMAQRQPATPIHQRVSVYEFIEGVPITAHRVTEADTDFVAEVYLGQRKVLACDEESSQLPPASEACFLRYRPSSTRSKPGRLTCPPWTRHLDFPPTSRDFLAQEIDPALHQVIEWCDSSYMARDPATPSQPSCPGGIQTLTRLGLRLS